MKIGQGLRTVLVLCFFANLVNAQDPALLAGKVVAENINNGAFTAVVKDVAKTVAPFLNAFTSVIKLIFGIQASSAESPELKYLRNMSESINRRFDQVNVQFNDVKNLIDWSAVQVSYGMLESNIHAVSDQFSRIFQVPESGANQQKRLFVISYHNGYIDSGSKLFTAFMQDHGVISQGLIRPAMKYTRNDRGKIRTFMLGILKLLMMAAKVELAYLGVKGYDSLIPFYIHQWQVRIEQVQEKMKAIDLELKNVYLPQSLKDIDRFALDSKNVGLSNQNYSFNLYQELSTKYFWRDWLVIASTHTEGRSDAHSRVCNGVIRSVYRTKDILVDSVERSKPSFNMREVEGLYASLKQTCSHTAIYNACTTPPPCYYNICGAEPYFYHGRKRRCGDYKNYSNADVIFNWFGAVRTSCSTYSSIGIISPNKNPAYYAGPSEGSSQRLFVKYLGLCKYNVHFFG